MKSILSAPILSELVLLAAQIRQPLYTPICPGYSKPGLVFSPCPSEALAEEEDKSGFYACIAPTCTKVFSRHEIDGIVMIKNEE